MANDNEPLAPEQMETAHARYRRIFHAYATEASETIAAPFLSQMIARLGGNDLEGAKIVLDEMSREASLRWPQTGTYENEDDKRRVRFGDLYTRYLLGVASAALPEGVAWWKGTGASYHVEAEKVRGEWSDTTYRGQTLEAALRGLMDGVGIAYDERPSEANVGYLRARLNEEICRQARGEDISDIRAVEALLSGWNPQIAVLALLSGAW
ncbi:hypothetical protein [Miltoncostaea oceani]|uniref:hypothetical protein n=1 Tax=Miltoncostaea oceani TaxID=2843216 RepID=UPI001C3E0171|nr:hypothetical protein [Miltoncostaea oceani]